MRSTLTAICLLALCAPGSIGCDSQGPDDLMEVEPGGGKEDSTFSSLAGSYYAFDGANWSVLMLSRPDDKGKGSFLSFALGAVDRGIYSIVDDTLALTTGFGASEATLVSKFQVFRDAGLVILFVTNELGSAAMFQGPLFCETAKDCDSQVPSDEWDCENFMCRPHFTPF